jgi:hypothetical protein
MHFGLGVATCNQALVELVLKFGATESIYEYDKIDPKALVLAIEKENLGIVDLLLKSEMYLTRLYDTGLVRNRAMLIGNIAISQRRADFYSRREKRFPQLCVAPSGSG